jgi:hypothetical protein
MSTLGMILTSTDRLAEGERIYSEELAMERRILGSDHPTTLLTMDQLAQTYSRLGQHDRALELLKQVQEAQSRVLGPEHEQTLSATHNIGVVLEQLGRREVSRCRTRTIRTSATWRERSPISPSQGGRAREAPARIPHLA